MSATSRKRVLQEAGLLHPNPELVRATLFAHPSGFFLADDKVQVKYEMLRSHVVDGVAVTEAAGAQGYSRASFYLVAAAFEAEGMFGLFDEQRGRRGPVKLTPEILAYLESAEGSGASVARDIEARFGVRLHRRTVERARP